MGMPSTAARTTVLFMLIAGGLCVAAVLGLTLMLPFFFHERDMGMVIENTSGRPVVVASRGDARSHGPAPGALVIGTGVWTFGAAECSPETLEARDLAGVVVATRDGYCVEDTWRITDDDLPPAPVRGDTPLDTDEVEVRVAVLSDTFEQQSVEWARALPDTLQRTRAAAADVGATVEGPFLEQYRITFYLRGPDAAQLLGLARTDLLRPAPEGALAWGGTRGGPAPTSGPPSVTLLDPRRRPVPTATPDPSISVPAVPERGTDPPVRE